MYDFNRKITTFGWIKNEMKTKYFGRLMCLNNNENHRRTNHKNVVTMFKLHESWCSRSNCGTICCPEFPVDVIDWKRPQSYVPAKWKAILLASQLCGSCHSNIWKIHPTDKDLTPEATYDACGTIFCRRCHPPNDDDKDGTKIRCHWCSSHETCHNECQKVCHISNDEPKK